MNLDAPTEFDLTPQAVTSEPPSKLRIGIVGLGRFVRNSTLDSYMRRGLNVVSASDLDSAARQTVSGRYPTVTTHEQWLDVFADDIDVLDINIPWDHGASKLRMQMVEEAASRGVHVQLAKPLADKFETCVRMVEVCESAGVRVSVNQNSRYAPAIYAARRLIQEGTVGPLLSASIRWQAARGLQHQPAFDVLRDVTVHQVDIVLSWFDQLPASVFAQRTRKTEAGSVVAAILTFGDGSHAVIHDDFASELTPSWPFRVVGELGTIDGTDDIEIPESGQPRMERSEVILGLRSRPGVSMRLPLAHRYAPDAYAATMVDLLSSIEAGRDPWASGRNVLRTMQVLSAMIESVTTGAPVELDATASQRSF